MPRSIYDGIRMQETDPALQSIRSKELKQAASAFVRNVEDLHALLTLPLGLLNVGLWEADRMHFLSDAVRLAPLKDAKSRTRRAAAAAKANRTFEKVTLRPASERARGRMVDIAETLLHNLLKNKTFDEVRFATRALFYASISSSWGAFESVAKDTWMAALNVHSTLLAQGAMAKIPTAGVDDPLRNKQISVGLLARHGYDLRRTMGILLAPKFDFTGISGIREAYAASFRNESSIANALANPVLGQLEATRHLIVHRAGWIDEEYQRRTGVPSSLGTRLVIDGKKISALSNAAIEAGGALLIAVDRWMIANSGGKAANRRKASAI
jgi:hypothetical protein